MKVVRPETRQDEKLFIGGLLPFITMSGFKAML
jgi:hypothetical protein